MTKEGERDLIPKCQKRGISPEKSGLNRDTKAKHGMKILMTKDKGRVHKKAKYLQKATEVITYKQEGKDGMDTGFNYYC